MHFTFTVENLNNGSLQVAVSLIVTILSGEFSELLHLVENSDENISNEEFLEQEITDYLFFRRHDKVVNVFLYMKSQILK